MAVYETKIKNIAVYETKHIGHSPSLKPINKIMAVYETKNCGHGPSRKSINKMMAIYETKIADHIIQEPHARLANPVRNVAANPVHKSGGC
jgi:hypothetical protein